MFKTESVPSTFITNLSWSNCLLDSMCKIVLKTIFCVYRMAPEVAAVERTGGYDQKVNVDINDVQVTGGKCIAPQDQKIFLSSQKIHWLRVYLYPSVERGGTLTLQLT